MANKFNFKALLILIVSSILGVLILSGMAHNTSIDKSQCLISQDDICISTSFLVVLGIFLVINVVLLYKVHPALFWIWLIIQAFGLFGGLQGLLEPFTGVFS